MARGRETIFRICIQALLVKRQCRTVVIFERPTYAEDFIYGHALRFSQHSHIIEFSGIESFIDEPVRTYSSGMRARLGFSIVSHMEPNILLLDEVMSVGDHDFRKRSRARIDEMVRGDATVVIVSHSANLLRALCNRVFYLEGGQFKTDGDKESAIKQYQSEKEGG